MYVGDEASDGVDGVVRVVDLLLVQLARHTANSLVGTRQMPAQNTFSMSVRKYDSY